MPPRLLKKDKKRDKKAEPQPKPAATEPCYDQWARDYPRRRSAAQEAHHLHHTSSQPSSRDVWLGCATSACAPIVCPTAHTQERALPAGRPLVRAAARQFKGKSPKARVAVFSLLRGVALAVPSALDPAVLAMAVPPTAKALADKDSHLKIEVGSTGQFHFS